MRVQDLIRAATKYGATVEEDAGGRNKVYQCVAPDGKQWNDAAHFLRVEWTPGLSTSKAECDEAIRDAILRMGAGLEDCPTDCDCRENPDFARDVADIVNFCNDKVDNQS